MFAKSAKDENYRKAVVKPTMEEILGGKFSQEINTTNVGSAPGVAGRTEGVIELETSNSQKKPGQPTENKPVEPRLSGKAIALLTTGGIIFFGLIFFLLMREKTKN